MSYEKIFEDKDRTDFNYANHLYDKFDFYDRSALPEFASVRNTINSWFVDYPEDEKKELKARFRKAFSPAFFELFIYQIFTRQGFKLTLHPEMKSSSKRPDFLAEKNGVQFYIEAKEMNDTSENEVALKNRLNTLYDAINKIDSPDFWLFINDISIKGQKQPSGKRLAEEVERKVCEFTLESIKAQMSSPTWTEHSNIEIDNHDVKVAITLLPKAAEIRGDKSIKPIGGLLGGAFWGGPDESIKTAIHKKASRYGELDKPYLICLNAFSDKGITAVGIEAVILGSLISTWSKNPNNEDTQLERAKDGVFFSQAGPKMTRVSGIFITSVFPSNICDAPHWLMKHPYGKNELDFTSFELSYQQFGSNYWQSVPGKSIGEILK